MANRDDDMFGRSGGRNRGRDSWQGGDPDRGNGIWNEGYKTSRFRDEEYGRGSQGGRDYDDYDTSTEGYSGGGYMGGDWSPNRGRDRGSMGPGDESDYGERGSGRFEQGGGYLGGNYRSGTSRRGGGYFGEQDEMSDRGYDRDRMRETSDRGDYGQFNRGMSGRGDFESSTRNFNETSDRGRDGMLGGYGSSTGYSSMRGGDMSRRESFRGRGPQGYSRSDERIEDDVNRMLTEDHDVDASDIEVKVSSGEVTLSGFVNSRDEKRRAEDIVERCFGVKDVTNQIRVRHESSQHGMTESNETMNASSQQGTSGNSGMTAGSSTGSAARSGRTASESRPTGRNRGNRNK